MVCSLPLEQALLTLGAPVWRVCIVPSLQCACKAQMRRATQSSQRTFLNQFVFSDSLLLQCRSPALQRAIRGAKALGTQ